MIFPTNMIFFPNRLDKVLPPRVGGKELCTSLPVWTSLPPCLSDQLIGLDGGQNRFVEDHRMDLVTKFYFDNGERFACSFTSIAV